MALREEEVPQIIKTSNSETSKSLPTEIILEILLRLPVESLLRCKSVCKLWFSLISDPHFVKSHLKLSTTSNDYAHHQLFWITKPIYRLIKTCPLKDVLFARSVVRSLDHGRPWSRSHYDGLHIVDSCNGLLCIVVNMDILFICNPSTRMWNRLPYCRFEKRFVVYSFGYDDLTDDYKVFGFNWVWNTGFGYTYPSKLLSLNSATWKNIDGFPDGIQLICYNGKFSNGAIHWAARDSKSSCDFTIVSFDLAKETYGQVSPPVYVHGDHKNIKLGVLGEWLCVLCNYRGYCADVWVMKVYGVKDSWTKLVSIPYLTAQPTLCDLISVPLFISNDGKLLLQLGKGELVVYDSKNNSFSEIQNFGACPEVCTFVESLVSLNTIVGLADNNVDEK